MTSHVLKDQQSLHWGRSYLIVPEFSWRGVEAAVERLLSHVARETWGEVANELAKELHWEFESYSDG